MAETRDQAETAFDFFLQAYGAKYDKAAACLAKDREMLLTFYDFPAEHWKHLRTTNPIESTFATVRLRTIKTKGCLSRMTALTMVFKLCQSASQKWRRLDGSHQLAEIIRGVKFNDGEKLTERQLMLWQPSMRNNQAMIASVRASTAIPLSLSVLMSPFWQKTQRILQEVKKIVPEPRTPR